MLENITEIDMKIISLFTKNYAKTYTIRQITTELDINYSHAFKRIKEMIQNEILVQSKQGQANIISINIFNLDAIKLLGFVDEMKRVENPMLYKIISEVISIDPFACTGLFGSRVSGKATKKSDWDLFIITTKQKKTERTLSKFSYTKNIQIQVFDITEFEQSLLNTEETVVKHIVKNKQILYNPHPFYNIIRKWEKIKHAPEY